MTTVVIKQMIIIVQRQMSSNGNRFLNSASSFSFAYDLTCACRFYEFFLHVGRPVVMTSCIKIKNMIFSTP